MLQKPSFRTFIFKSVESRSISIWPQCISENGLESCQCLHRALERFATLGLVQMLSHTNTHHMVYCRSTQVWSSWFWDLLWSHMWILVSYMCSHGNRSNISAAHHLNITKTYLWSNQWSGITKTCNLLKHYHLSLTHSLTLHSLVPTIWLSLCPCAQNHSLISYLLLEDLFLQPHKPFV